MAKEDLNQELLDAVPPFSRAIPGQSLTNDPDDSLPWETPPEFVTVQDGLDYLFETLIDPERLPTLIEVLGNNSISISALAQTILEQGFRTGKWKTDLMLLLAEPLMIILMALAERAGIGDYEIYEGEERELDSDAGAEILENRKNSLQENIKFRGMKMPPINMEVIPENIKETIENIPQEELKPKSLLER